MARATMDSVPVCQYIMDTLLKIPGLKVVDKEVQSGLPGLAYRDIILDVVAEDTSGTIYNIEIQIGTKLKCNNLVKIALMG